MEKKKFNLFSHYILEAALDTTNILSSNLFWFQMLYDKETRINIIMFPNPQFYLAEQVSHHPPISAFYATNRQVRFGAMYVCTSICVMQFFYNSINAFGGS